MWAVIGILSGLMIRHKTGQGCHVETSLFEITAWWLNYHIKSNLSTGNTPVRYGTGTPFIAPYEVFPVSDEGLLVCVGIDNLFQRFAEALGIPEIAKNDRFATNPHSFGYGFNNFASTPSRREIKALNTVHIFRCHHQSTSELISSISYIRNIKVSGVPTNFEHVLVVYTHLNSALKGTTIDQ